ncbi:ImmA/IrrE family metallo-endopeptidase [Clostridium sardiniense]|uniref:ImmA/IrrE family metallo-endopeptidase n=1 Tax=Clostridium sardiniense TaxID=29369 RepID=UPI003D340615
MTKYENLLNEAHKQGAQVIEIDLGTDTPCGKCINNIIILNSRMNIKNKYCILAEELGHYRLNYGDITNQCKIENKKQEIIARRYGYDKNIGLIGLIEAFEHGCSGKFEIAEYLGITEEYLEEAINYYKCKYGDMYEIDNYLIYFIPNLFIGKSF